MEQYLKVLEEKLILSTYNSITSENNLEINAKSRLLKQSEAELIIIETSY